MAKRSKLVVAWPDYPMHAMVMEGGFSPTFHVDVFATPREWLTSIRRLAATCAGEAPPVGVAASKLAMQSGQWLISKPGDPTRTGADSPRNAVRMVAALHWTSKGCYTAMLPGQAAAAAAAFEDALALLNDMETQMLAPEPPARERRRRK